MSVSLRKSDFSDIEDGDLESLIILFFNTDDSNRVKLWPYPDQKGSDYINASFIDVSI